MATRPARPQALTLTCLFVGIACALILTNLVGALQSWGSIAMQDAIRSALDSPPVSELGMSVERAMDLLRYAAWVGVVLTVAGLVFAVYTAMGHRVSRIMLTGLCALAAVTFAAAGLVGLLPALFASISAWSLWSSDARRWFDEVDGRIQPSPATDRPARPTLADLPGGVDPQRVVGPAPGAAPVAEAAPAPPAASGAPSTPRPVRVAVITTVISCGVVALLGALMLLVSTLGADAYRASLEEPGLARDLVRSTGVSSDEVVGLLRGSAVVWLVLSALGLVSALAAAQRRRSGSVALQSAAFATIAVSVFFIPFGVLTAAAAVVVIVQLRRPEARAWFAAAR